MVRIAQAASSRAGPRPPHGGDGVDPGQSGLGEEFAVGEDAAGSIGAKSLGELAVDGGVGGVVEAQFELGAEQRLGGDPHVVPAQHARHDVDAVAAAALEEVSDGVV